MPTLHLEGNEDSWLLLETLEIEASKEIKTQVFISSSRVKFFTVKCQTRISI